MFCAVHGFLQALPIERDVEPSAKALLFAMTVKGCVTVTHQNELSHVHGLLLSMNDTAVPETEM